MEWVVVGVVVVVALVALMVMRRRRLEAETHARQTAAGRGDEPTGDRG
jgi:hypothetical protein